MALTNAEKQKRWRDRRNALAKRAVVLDWRAPSADVDALKARCAALEAELREERQRREAVAESLRRTIAENLT